MDDTYLKKFVRKMMSGTQLFWIRIQGDEQTAEQHFLRRAAEIFSEVEGLEQQMPVHVWDAVQGGTWKSGLDKISAALASMPQAGRGIYILRDLDSFLLAKELISIRRQLLELCKEHLLNGQDAAGNAFIRPIVIFTYEASPPVALRDFCDVTDFPLPDQKQFKEDTIPRNLQGIATEIPDDAMESMSGALLGLSDERAGTVISNAVAINGGLNGDLQAIIADEKCSSINQIDGLTYIPYRKIAEKGTLGGYDNLMNFVAECKATMSPLARRLGLERSKGYGIIGPPGTGKTSMAEMTANLLGMDLIQMDISSLYSKWLGDSQRRAREAFSTIKAVKRAVVLIDEAEKAIGHANDVQSGDSGVSSQILSLLLKFLAERDTSADSDESLLVICTMNRIAGLPPELLRAGRFDQIFFADLPTDDERLDILKIHLRKRGIDPEIYGKALSDISRAAKDFSGAELEQLVVRSRKMAFTECFRHWQEKQSDDSGQLPTAKDVCPSLEHLEIIRKKIRPTAQKDTTLAELRKWGKENCESVSTTTTSSGMSRKITLGQG